LCSSNLLQLLDHLTMILCHFLSELLDARALCLLLSQFGELNFGLILC